MLLKQTLNKIEKKSKTQKSWNHNIAQTAHQGKPHVFQVNRNPRCLRIIHDPF